jgi:branched-subunit amino acid aminotransferase/4-amino-4-deoxychorismate lyase
MHDYELYGYSLFETLAAHGGRFWRPRDHWLRLRGSALKLDFPYPSWAEFRDSLRQVHDPSRSEVLRYTLLRTGGAWSGVTEARWQARVLSKPLQPV